jgi:cbb3-type cytochrome oxidase subunit 1
MGCRLLKVHLLSIKSVSALGHYTDWIIGHVHGGGIGWNYMMAAAMLTLASSKTLENAITLRKTW